MFEEETRNETGEEKEGNVNDSGSLNDFHQMLIIRVLRPDRFPAAVAVYTSTHIGQVLSEPNPATTGLYIHLTYMHGVEHYTYIYIYYVNFCTYLQMMF